MVLHSLRDLFRRPARSRKRAPAGQRPPRPFRTRLSCETLEDRLLLEAQPINLGEHLQFRLVDSSKSWTQSGGVYSSTDQVKIGLQGASFQSLLAVDSGIEIDTNATRQSFTIKATPTAHNALFYYPKDSLTL